MNNDTARSAGFTKHVIADCPEYTLNLLISPDTYYDNRFRAWDLDEQEWIAVNGWLFDINDTE